MSFTCTLTSNYTVFTFHSLFSPAVCLSDSGFLINWMNQKPDLFAGIFLNKFNVMTMTVLPLCFSSSFSFVLSLSLSILRLYFVIFVLLGWKKSVMWYSAGDFSFLFFLPFCCGRHWLQRHVVATKKGKNYVRTFGWYLLHLIDIFIFRSFLFYLFSLSLSVLIRENELIFCWSCGHSLFRL